MILEVEHQLIYTYSDYVHLNPHYFYLSPNLTPYQKLIQHEISVLPQVDKLVRNRDQENNAQHVCFINIETKRFEIVSKFTLETIPFNLYDFIFFPFETVNIPLKYPEKLHRYAQIFFEINPVHPRVRDLSNHLAKLSNYKTLDFISLVMRYIHEHFTYIPRERGDAQRAYDTLMAKSGSCRDFSVLMMALCAHQGLLARFVSGYLYGSNRHQHDLHAWVEVFLPGGGWRGYDPTEGQAINANYIALASSFEPVGITPVRGTFRSKEPVESHLETRVSITEI